MVLRNINVHYYYKAYLNRYYRGADKSLARPGKKQARRHVRDARDFNNIETRAVIKSPPTPLRGKTTKEIHAILTETLACFFPGRAKDLSAPPVEGVRGQRHAPAALYPLEIPAAHCTRTSSRYFTHFRSEYSRHPILELPGDIRTSPHVAGHVSRPCKTRHKTIVLTVLILTFVHVESKRENKRLMVDWNLICSRFLRECNDLCHSQIPEFALFSEV